MAPTKRIFEASGVPKQFKPLTLPAMADGEGILSEGVLIHTVVGSLAGLLRLTLVRLV